ncbi:MAG: hypothetical protein IPH74_03150 [Bacteroidetes bacterium]|nr:hypothetical protein [Bacteroidota bacterium]
MNVLSLIQYLLKWLASLYFGIYCATNQKAKNISRHLISKGIDIRAILYPTVPLGLERLRFIIHSFNTKEEIDFLLDELNIQSKLYN